MKLGVGSNITCEEMKTLESNFWKKLYGKESWQKEKYRLQRVERWFSKYIPEVELRRIGLGADHNEYLENVHSQEAGAPDLSITYQGKELILLEVSGTERRRGEDFWVRKDKVDFIQDYVKDIWIILHYKLPSEEFIWVKVSPHKKYPQKIINVKGANEHYVMFSKLSEEVVSSAEFKSYLLNKITKLS